MTARNPQIAVSPFPSDIAQLPSEEARSVTTAIDIDLSRDLPKVREHYPFLVAELPNLNCDYTAPCVIGAMVPPADRLRMENSCVGNINDFIGRGLVIVPKGQSRDLGALQKAYDSGDLKRFERVLSRAEAKYLAQVSA